MVTSRGKEVYVSAEHPWKQRTGKKGIRIGNERAEEMTQGNTKSGGKDPIIKGRRSEAKRNFEPRGFGGTTVVLSFHMFGGREKRGRTREKTNRRGKRGGKKS